MVESANRVVARTIRRDSDAIEQTELPGCLDVRARVVAEVQEEAYPAGGFRAVSVREVPDDPRMPVDVQWVGCDESVVAESLDPGVPIDLVHVRPLDDLDDNAVRADAVRHAAPKNRARHMCTEGVVGLLAWPQWKIDGDENMRSIDRLLYYNSRRPREGI